MSLENDLTIDQSHLDAEWITLPSLYFKYREESDYLDIQLRKKKMTLDFEMSKLDGEVRLDPKSYIGSEKATEKQISCYIESRQEIYELRCQILEVERKKKLVQSAYEALEMKRDALKNLVQLLNSEYFSTRRTDGESEQYIQGKSQVSKRNIRREIRERMNSKNTNQEGDLK